MGWDDWNKEEIPIGRPDPEKVCIVASLPCALFSFLDVENKPDWVGSRRFVSC